jgi:ABC-2 type transport system permease protein
MVLRIARRELLETLRDRRFRWSAGVIAALIGVSFLSGWDYVSRTARYENLVQSAERDRWLNKGEMNPHSAAHYGQFLFKPRLSLEAVDPGIAPYSGASIFIEPHHQNLPRYKPAADSGTLSRAGQLTVAGTLQLLIPLLIILSLYSTFTAEREQGTLRLLLSLGISPRRLAAGKAIGAAIPWIALLVPASIAGAFLLARSGSSASSWDIALRSALMAAAYLLYFVSILLITISVSALVPRSRTALAILLGFWFVSGILAPPLAMNVAAARHPVPNGFEFEAAISKDMAPLPGIVPRAFAIEKRMLKEYGVASAKELPLNPSGLALLDQEADAEVVYEKHFNHLRDTYEQQNRLFSLMGVLSPLLPLQSFSMGLAGTDYPHMRDFAERVEAYRYKFVQTLNEDDARNGKMYDSESAQGINLYKAGRDLWESIPPFHYNPPDVGWAVRRNVTSIAVLLGWFLLAAAALPFALKRLRTE